MRKNKKNSPLEIFRFDAATVTNKHYRVIIHSLVPLETQQTMYVWCPRPRSLNVAASIRFTTFISASFHSTGRVWLLLWLELLPVSLFHSSAKPPQFLSIYLRSTRLDNAVASQCCKISGCKIEIENCMPSVLLCCILYTLNQPVPD